MNYILKYLPVLLLLLPISALAHGLVTTQSQTAGNYLIEFEYNTQGSILTGDYMLFNVYLLNPKTRDGIDFDSSFIRIEKQGGAAQLAGNLAQAADIKGFASISGVLNEPGTYTVKVSFYKNGKTLAESEFNFMVEKNQFEAAPVPSNPKKSFYFEAYVFLVGAALGALGMRFWRVYKSPGI